MRNQIKVRIAFIIVIVAFVVYGFSTSNSGFLITIPFLLFPLAAIADLIEFHWRQDKSIKSKRFDSKINFIIGYLLPLLLMGFIILFLNNPKFYNFQNFGYSENKAINVNISIAAFLSIAGQIGNLISSLTSKFLRFRILSYIGLFFISYLTCGLCFAILFDLNSEGLKNVTQNNKAIDVIYFSFVTLATTGFGDISPISNVTKLLVILENIFGLFLTAYIVTMIFSSTRK